MVSKPGILILVALTSVSVAAQGIRPQDVDFQRAVRIETVEGDKREAIRQFGQLVDKYETTDPRIAAQSLARMGQLLQSLGDTATSRSVFERILRDFPKQDQPAALARRALGDGGRRITQERVSPGIGDKGADAVSPDGRSIVFASRDGFIIRRNGSTQNHVSVEADTPFFSPDSKRVVYNQWGFGTTERRPSEFRVASLEGRWSPRNVKTSPSNVRYYNPGGWSADGQSVLVEIVYQDLTKEIAWLSLATGETRVLTKLGHRRPQDQGERLSLSPDGRWIVYAAFPVDPGANQGRQTPERSRHLYLLPAQGGTPIEIVGGNVNVRPLWTPDSRSVVFVSNRSGSFGLWSVRAGDSREAPVVEMASSGRVASVAITKNGDFYFRRDQTGFDLFVADVRSDGRVGAPVPLPTTESGGNFTPAWSPDRRSLAYMRARQDGPSGRYSLVVHSMSDHTERVFDSRELAYGAPKWFADGARVLVSGQRTGRGSIATDYVVDVASGTFTPVAGVVSLDGKGKYVETKIASQGVSSITAVDLTAGTRRVVLAQTPGDPRSPLVVSPDGRALAFITAKTGVNTGSLWVIGVDGQGLRELSTAASNRVVAWSPDSQSIYFLEQRGDASRLMRAPVSGGAPQDTGLTLPYDKQRAATLAGNQLVFAQEAAVHELWVVKDFAAR